jgi:hypothetical protein
VTERSGLLPGPDFHDVDAGFVPPLDAESLQRARHVLVEADAPSSSLDEAIDATALALTLFCLKDPISWKEIRESLEAKRDAARALSAALGRMSPPRYTRVNGSCSAGPPSR